MNTKDTLYQELASLNQPLGVISTVNKEGDPQSGSVYYVFDKDLNIYFITREGSRKYKNIQGNPHVSFVVFSQNPPKTIQLEGVAYVDTDAHEESEFFTDLVSLASKHTMMPPVSQIEGSKMVFVKISTTWAREGNFEALSEGDKFIETSLI